MSTSKLKTYQGNCHCGGFKFTVNLPEVKKATACNCSICYKKGYLWVFPGAGEFKVERGESKLVTYEFANKTMAHKFCPKCGTGVIGQRYGAPPGMDIGVNARTLIGVDPFSLEIGKYEGATLDPAYEPTPFTGQLPIISGEDTKVYTGSCHCGNVTVAVKTMPLPEANVREDNCSICARNATTFLYAPRPNVTIVGAENTTTYTFGDHEVFHHFCKTCGVPMYVEFDPSTGEGELLPVNMKVLNGVEWEELKVKRNDCGTEGYVIA